MVASPHASSHQLHGLGIHVGCMETIDHHVNKEEMWCSVNLPLQILDGFL